MGAAAVVEAAEGAMAVELTVGLTVELTMGVTVELVVEMTAERMKKIAKGNKKSPVKWEM